MHRTQFAKEVMVSQDIWTVLKSKCGAMSETHGRNFLGGQISTRLTYRILYKLLVQTDFDYKQITCP